MDLHGVLLKTASSSVTLLSRKLKISPLHRVALMIKSVSRHICLSFLLRLGLEGFLR